MTDPGAEMRARAREAACNALFGEVESVQIFMTPREMLSSAARYNIDRHTEALAAFAAKEVARATEGAIVKLTAEAIAIVVEEERMACTAAMCNNCKASQHTQEHIELAEKIDGEWSHHEVGYDRKCTFGCYAGPIHERSQVKGEGL